MEAQYWVNEAGVRQFQQDTSYLIIANALRDQIMARFDADLYVLLKMESFAPQRRDKQRNGSSNCLHVSGAVRLVSRSRR